MLSQPPSVLRVAMIVVNASTDAVDVFQATLALPVPKVSRPI